MFCCRTSSVFMLDSWFKFIRNCMECKIPLYTLIILQSWVFISSLGERILANLIFDYRFQMVKRKLKRRKEKAKRRLKKKFYDA